MLSLSQLQLHLRVFGAEAERAAAVGFHILAAKEVEKSVKGIAGQGDLVLAVSIAGMAVAVPMARADGPEFLLLVHQNPNELPGAVVEALDAVVQLSILAQHDGISLVYIRQEIRQMLHHIQLLPTHPKGKGGILVVHGIHPAQPGQQPGIRPLRLHPAAVLHVGFQQIPGVPVADHPALRIPGAVDHGRRQMLAGLVKIKLKTAATTLEPSAFLLRNRHLIKAIPLDAALHFGPSILQGVAHMMDLSLVEILHAPLKNGSVKHTPNLLYGQLNHSPTSRLFSTFYLHWNSMSIMFGIIARRYPFAPYQNLSFDIPLQPHIIKEMEIYQRKVNFRVLNTATKKFIFYLCYQWHLHL